MSDEADPTGPAFLARELPEENLAKPMTISWSPIASMADWMMSVTDAGGVVVTRVDTAKPPRSLGKLAGDSRLDFPEADLLEILRRPWIGPLKPFLEFAMRNAADIIEARGDRITELEAENAILRAHPLLLSGDAPQRWNPGAGVWEVVDQPAVAQPGKGEFVTCEAGHLVCEVVADSAAAGPASCLGAWRAPGMTAAVVNWNDARCPFGCGAKWFDRGRFHIKGRGWV